jgi:hypothetical protein
MLPLLLQSTLRVLCFSLDASVGPVSLSWRSVWDCGCLSDRSSSTRASCLLYTTFTGMICQAEDFSCRYHVPLTAEM